MTTTTGQITTIGTTRLTRLGDAIARWARRRAVRASISEVYLDDETRRAQLEERLLADLERRTAQRELERTVALTALYRLP